MINDKEFEALDNLLSELTRKNYDKNREFEDTTKICDFIHRICTLSRSNPTPNQVKALDELIEILDMVENQLVRSPVHLARIKHTNQIEDEYADSDDSD